METYKGSKATCRISGRRDLKALVVSGTDPSNEVCAIDIYKPTAIFETVRRISSTLGDTYAIQASKGSTRVGTF